MKCKILAAFFVVIISFSSLFAQSNTGHKTVTAMWVGRWGEFTVYLDEGDNSPAYYVKSSVMGSEDMKRFYALALLCYSTGGQLDIEWEANGTQRIVRCMSPKF